MFNRFVTSALFATAALTASSVVVSPAFAGTTGEYRSTRVSYADLDLSSDAGVATLQGRIERAARQVCGNPWVGNLGELLEVNKCRSYAIANAGRAMVTVIARANTGERLASRESGSVSVRGR